MCVFVCAFVCVCVCVCRQRMLGKKRESGEIRAILRDIPSIWGSCTTHIEFLGELNKHRFSNLAKAYQSRAFGCESQRSTFLTCPPDDLHLMSKNHCPLN